MSSVRKGLVISFSERYVLIAIQLASAMILARLLTPEEIGIYSVSLAVIGIAQVLREFGVGNYLVQEKTLTDAHIRTAFGLSLLIGGLLFVLVYAVAPWAGEFYEEPRMVETIRLSALNFLVLPFCTVSVALLRRNMQFMRLAFVNIAASVTGLGVGVYLAYSGYGPNSMAIAAVSGNLVTGFLAWLVQEQRRLLLPSLSEWRVLGRFGGLSSTANILSTVSMEVNDLALGRILGFAPVAILSRAQGLMNLFHRDLMAAVRRVAFPAFAKAHRDGEVLDERYVASVVSLTAIAWPVYGFFAMYAHELIMLMFGPQWTESVPLVPIFCLAGAVAATCNLALDSVLAVGRVDLVTKVEVLIQPLRAAMIIAAALWQESLIACAVAYLSAAVLAVPVIYSAKDKCIPTHYTSLIAGFWRSFVLSCVALTGPLLVSTQVPDVLSTFDLILWLSGAGIATGLGWLAGLVIVRHPLRYDPLLRKLVSTLRLPVI